MRLSLIVILFIISNSVHFAFANSVKTICERLVLPKSHPDSIQSNSIEIIFEDSGKSIWISVDELASIKSSNAVDVELADSLLVSIADNSISSGAVRSINVESKEVFAQMMNLEGVRASGSWDTIAGAFDVVLKNPNLNPYFVGVMRKANKSLRIIAKRVDGYHFPISNKKLRLDFTKEFPELSEFKVRTFKLNSSKKLTQSSREEAIEYIRRHFPDADDYRITYLNNGGFNAVFKACPKGGGGCKVIKLPGIDEAPLIKLKEIQGQIENLNNRIKNINSIHNQLHWYDSEIDKYFQGNLKLETDLYLELEFIYE